MKSAHAANAAIQVPRGVRSQGRTRGTRKGLLAVALGTAMLTATACGSHSTEGGAPGSDKPSQESSVVAAPKTSQARISIAPKDGATSVSTSGKLKVSAAKGKLRQVDVESTDGDTVKGSISADGTSWTPTGPLHTGTRYKVSATAVDSAGLTSAGQSSFTTLTPAATNIGYFNFDKGKTYGVGMEVSINFTKPVTDSAAVKDAISVTAEPAVPVEGHWFGNQRIDFRPEEYWKPGTKVTLHLRLNGVETSHGVYGQQSKDVSFTVGRSQTSVADNTAHTLKVYRDGSLYRTLPASLGDATHTTYNGKMVIEEKDPVVHMDSQTVGLGDAYDIPDVPHGMRLTPSGTFVHGNYWRPTSTFGSENTSHGCVGLHDVRGGGDPSAPAAWFYNHSLIGDVVKVVHSPDKTVAPDNGWNGWNMSWSEWTAN